MCYSCSPGCDNCFAKFLECPDCGHIEMLGRDECSQCGRAITQEMREAAEAEWRAGRRFSQGGKGRNLVVERMIAEGVFPAAPGAVALSAEPE